MEMKVKVQSGSLSYGLKVTKVRAYGMVIDLLKSSMTQT